MEQGSGTYADQAASSFLHDVQKLVDSWLASGVTGDVGDCKVSEYLSPEQLQEVLQVPISDKGLSRDELMSVCEKMLKYSVNTHHARFYNQLHTGPDIYGLAGETVSDALNSNPHIYLVSPCLILSENFVIEELGKILPYSNVDGIFVPGASMGNFLAIHAARYKLCPEAKTDGLYGQPPLKIFASQDVHYSVTKAASFLGIGTSHCVSIATDATGHMCSRDLDAKMEQCKHEGSRPLVVVATSGTTVLGAFDPLHALADVCQKHGVWLHVDASWGGPALFSKTHRHLLDGISRSQSVVFTFHKLLGAPLQCSMLLVQDDPTLLAKCNTEKASYLFADNCLYDTKYELGNKTVQCGRKADGFKAWLMWLARGHSGMEQRVDKMFHLSRYIRDQINRRESFLLVSEVEYVNVNFWFVPRALRGQERNDNWWKQVGQATEDIKKDMTLTGNVMINCQPMPSYGYVTFFRLIVANPAANEADMDFILDEIERLGNAIGAK